MATPFIQSVVELQKLCQHLSHEKWLAVDTEFIRETTFFPKMALIQLATDKESFLIDPLAFKKEELDPVKDLLLNPNILKVMHAAYADQECFYWALGEVAEPVLDTAIAAGLLGLGDNIGLSKLLKEVLDIHVPKGRSRVKWLERPLSKELLDYAELDVRYLVRLGTTLIRKLESKNRYTWAIELSRVGSHAFDEQPENIAERLGRNAHWGDRFGYPVLIELVKWREARARELNQPRHWVCDNDILLSLAKVKPKSPQELKTFRGLSVKEVDRAGDRILAAIKTGLARKDLPEIERHAKKPRSGPHENHVADLIQTYVYYLASELEIVPRHLLTGEQAENLVEHGECSVDEWVRLRILTKQAAHLIGNDLKMILEGKKGLLVRNRKLIVFPVPNT